MNVEFLQLLLLIIIANGAPILIHVLLQDVFSMPVDFAKKLPDDEPIFGASKTWRGILAALLATPVAAWLLGYPAETGLLVAVFVVLGDLGSSFIKRRLRLAPSSQAILLDQIPESLLPAFLMRHVFHLDIASVMLLVLIFIIIELVLSNILFRWGLRKQPY